MDFRQVISTDAIASLVDKGTIVCWVVLAMISSGAVTVTIISMANAESIASKGMLGMTRLSSTQGTDTA